MIHSLRLSNFKGFREAQVDFERLTLLVGPNGVGKTTLLEAVWLLGKVAACVGPGPEFSRCFEGKWDLAKLLRSGADLGALSIRSGENELNCEIRTKRLDVKWNDESIQENQGGLVKMLIAKRMAPLTHISRVMLNVENMFVASPVFSEKPGLEEGLLYLPSFLQHLNNLRDGSLEKIEAVVQSVLPRFKRTSFEPVKINAEQAGVRLLITFDTGETIPAEHVSEGTLVVLALLTAVLAPGGYTTLLIDDLDRALHPAAQVRVLEAIRKAMVAAPELQIIATTHSPDLVDACDPSEVRVLGYDERGEPAVAPLLAHPEAAAWLKQLRPGEFWNSAGEDWVARAAGVPGAAPPTTPPEAGHHG